MCIHEIADPFITCCFINQNELFVSLYHNHQRMHYHFIYDLDIRAISGNVATKQLTSRSNFPCNAFYNDDKNEIYCFYRQGQAFSV